MRITIKTSDMISVVHFQRACPRALFLELSTTFKEPARGLCSWDEKLLKPTNWP